MCSIAWAFRDGGYELRFNRDEKWARPVSADPAFEPVHPVPGACARDASAGGTWLFTNENGLTLAVMNAYPGGKIPAPGRRSRGLIPFAAASAASIDQAADALMAAGGWEDYAPFEAVFIAEGEMRHFGWDGESFRRLPAPGRNFLTTSSIAGETVKAARNARYDAISASPLSVILADSATTGTPATAIYVTREDGGTVSQTSVLVTATEIRFAVQRRDEPVQEIRFPRSS